MKKMLVLTSLVSLLSACGAVSNMTHKNKNQAATEKLGGSNTGKNDCLFLGTDQAAMPDYGKPASGDGYDHTGPDVPVYVPGKDIPQNPGQNPTYPPGQPTGPNYPSQPGKPTGPDYPNQPGKPSGPDYPNQQPGQPETGSFDVKIPQPTPPPYQPSQPTRPLAPCKASPQTPDQGKSDGKGSDYFHPIGTEPQPNYPTQAKVEPTKCGKDGKFCDDGAKGQWPAQTSSGQSYDQKDAEGCFEAFRKNGYDTKGMWNIAVKEAKNVSVLSNSTFTDNGTEPTLVIIKSVNVLGSMDYQLLNPNALYCIKSVSVLQDTHVTSCLQSNVVFGKDVSVLSGANNQVVNCHY